MASGRPPTLIVFVALKVFMSKTVTVSLPPLLVKPSFRSGTTAAPWTPGVSMTSPTTFSVSTSTTVIRLPRET